MTATLARRLANLEALLRQLPATGCTRCAGLPDYALEWDDPEHGGWKPCAAGPDCAGCAFCLARSNWPEGFRCPGCGWEPAQVITISYMSDDDPRMQRAAASAVAEPEAAPEPPTPVSTEKTQAEVLAEVHAAIAALAA
jgi:hypothetical protein